MTSNEIKPLNANLSKRHLEELSYSFAATDIGSKTGTRIKTITVIKNLASKKHKTLKIDPELHKHDDWGSAFRDNFDKFGKIPDIPDVFKKEQSGESEMNTSAEDEVMQEEPKVEVVEVAQPKEIPIYEEPEPELEAVTEPELESEPEPESTVPAEEEKEEEAVESSSEEPEVRSRVIQKLPADIELIDIGPISLKQAEQSAKSQALRFKSYHPEKEGLKEYRSYPSTSENPGQNYNRFYNGDGSKAQSIYTSYPNIKYTHIPYTPTTTAANPYIAPNKAPPPYSSSQNVPPNPYVAPNKKQSRYKFENKAIQKVATTPEPYLAPSIRKMYSTIRPVTLAEDPRPTAATLNNNQYQGQRFRGVRY